MGMVGEACLPSNAYYPRTPDYTLCSGVHVCWSEHSDSSFVYGFMILDYGFGTKTATTFFGLWLMHCLSLCALPLGGIDRLYILWLWHFLDINILQSTRYLELAYFELPPISKWKSGPCFNRNMTIGNKIMWKRGEISPLFHNIFSILRFSGVKLHIRLWNVFIWSRSISESPLDFEITRVDCIFLDTSISIPAPKAQKWI